MPSATKHRPIRVKVERDSPRVWSWTGSNNQPLHIGCDDNCDLKIGKQPGPALLFELRPTDGPIQLFTPLKPQELGQHVELSVDGKPITTPTLPLHFGSQVDVLDKATQQRYRLEVEDLHFWARNLRHLLPVLLTLIDLSVAAAVYLFSRIEKTETRLSATEQQVTDAEELLTRMQQTTLSQQVALSNGLRQLEELNNATAIKLRSEFDERLESVMATARQQLQDLAGGDEVARQSLEQRTEEKIEELRVDFSNKMIDSYEKHKDLEDRMLRVWNMTTAINELTR